ncbi:membrane-bound lytic murein transglycosylase A [Xaviernesmea oryzae]|uniref:peptidoglycan lytic exotransglycosylase n=1 Tax=Xaviernesmea oryzae TaxID=464029 RepID=A0A1X7EI86_9HYPH|nr:murein transglycosylase A [Xaviernesmea oryzae]SMF34316.1 membrane-bound lytic murein transglycosylase A [Xaviernesmea oryzae]
MTGSFADFTLRPVPFSDLAGWENDDPAALFAGLRACLEHIRKVKPYRMGSLGLTADELADFIEDVGDAPADPASARALFEDRCTPFLISRADGRRGFVTAFYEPEVEVSETRDAVWAYPFYYRPDDLVDLDETNRPAGMDSGYMFARLTPDGIVPYPDRGEIDRGFLEGRGLEIAYAKSKIDVFFTHVQGAARLKYPDGRVRRITYAAKAGHPFSPVGKLLIDRGEIDPAEISMQSIRAWLARNPAKVDEVLWHNRSYIFFRDADVSDPSLGPVAAAKVPLIAGRSLAVDRQVHTFGFPFFIRSESLTHLDGGKPFGRLMLALDTGSAIVGPARGDIFTGSGFEAGELAGTVRNDADFYILIPKAAASRYGG